MTNARFRLYDLDHRAPALGGMPSEHDFCQVYDTTRTTTHPLTGELQHVLVFSGTRGECAAWVQSRERRRPMTLRQTIHDTNCRRHTHHTATTSRGRFEGAAFQTRQEQDAAFAAFRAAHPRADIGFRSCFDTTCCPLCVAVAAEEEAR